MEEKRFNRLLERYKYSPEAVKELYEYYYPIIVRYINRQFPRRGRRTGRSPTILFKAVSNEVV